MTCDDANVLNIYIWKFMKSLNLWIQIYENFFHHTDKLEVKKWKRHTIENSLKEKDDVAISISDNRFFKVRSTIWDIEEYFIIKGSIIYKSTIFLVVHPYNGLLFSTKTYSMSYQAMKRHVRTVMDWMPLFPPDSYVEALTRNVMVFGDGAFGGK